MRSKRVRALVAGAVVTSSERRALKRQHYLERRAKAGFSKDPTKPRGTRAAATGTQVARGHGLDGAKPPPTGWHHSTPRHRPLQALGKFFGALSDRGKELALRLWAGPPRAHGSQKSLAARPREPGQGQASSLSKPALQARIERLRGYIGVKQYEEVR